MTDYIEWILETVEDEEEREALLADGRRRGGGAAGAARPAAGAVRAGAGTKTAAWGHATRPGDRGEPPVAGIARGEGIDLRGRRSAPDHRGELAQSIIGADSVPAEAVFGAEGPGGGGIEWARGPRAEDAWFMDRVRRTTAAAAALERRGAAGRTVVETEVVSSPAADPAALDLAFQRDARRYDGAFTLY